MKPIYLSEKEALRLVIEERTCPPYDILMEGGADVDAHLQHCERCRDMVRLDGGSHTAFKALSADVPPPPLETEAKAGELRRLLRNAAPEIHNEHGWHNPPLVLVVDDEDATGINGVVRVVQVCAGLALCGPHDVRLTSWDGDVFAEPWNSWPVLISSLSKSLGEVAPEELARVRENQPKPMPWIPEDSLLYIFRHLELNIGGFFGQHGAAQAMRLMEGRHHQHENTSDTCKASVADFRNLSIAEMRGILKNNLESMSSAAFVARPVEYALAADSRPVELSAQERVQRDKGFGPPQSGIVNIFDLADPAAQPVKLDAEFRILDGLLDIIFHWNTPTLPVDAVILPGEGGSDLWPQLEQDTAHPGLLSMTVEVEGDIVLGTLKVILFTFTG